jgi:hypothetical protein
VIARQLFGYKKVSMLIKNPRVMNNCLHKQILCYYTTSKFTYPGTGLGWIAFKGGSAMGKKDSMPFNAGYVFVWMCVTLCEKVCRVHARKKLPQDFPASKT